MISCIRTDCAASSRRAHIQRNQPYLV